MITCSLVSVLPETCAVLFLPVWASFALPSILREICPELPPCPAGPGCLSGISYVPGSLPSAWGLWLGSVPVSSPALVPPAGPDLGLRAGVALLATGPSAFIPHRPRGLCFLSCMFLHLPVLRDRTIFLSCLWACF